MTIVISFREFIAYNTEKHMYEFLEQHSIYIVLVITLMVWTGVFLYLVRIDRNVRKFEEG